ncbi:MAG: aldo/keto reductase [Candidatus Brocadiaceae bacterium]|nr:aldo/keto reductase [Candidatus Brocadiaceae bacterium]
MIDRRSFLISLAGLTTGILLPGCKQKRSTTTEGTSSDRLGSLLPTRALGRTAEAVTMLGVGGWHIGRMSERDAQATIEVALEGGVRFFDTAETYQSGDSERYFGKFLTPKYRDKVYLMTKTTARDANTARRHLKGSLSRMKTDYLDLWQVHNLSSSEDTDERIQGGIFDVLLEAKESGKVRHIGFTGHARPSSHLRALDKTDIFDACQMPINLADPSYESFIEHVLPKLIERKIGVLAMKTLANGGFFGGSQHGEHGNNPKVVPDLVSIREAIHFVWSLPVSVLITGPDNPLHMKEKISLARSFAGMDEEQRKELVAKVAAMAGKRVEFYKA